MVARGSAPSARFEEGSNIPIRRAERRQRFGGPRDKLCRLVPGVRTSFANPSVAILPRRSGWDEN